MWSSESQRADGNHDFLPLDLAMIGLELPDHGIEVGYCAQIPQRWLRLKFGWAKSGQLQFVIPTPVIS